MAIKVLLVDDSGVMRHIVATILEKDASIQVIGTSHNGKDAVKKVEQLNPDVVIMDMIMGEFDGLYAVKNIMAEKPTPIILLSSLGNYNLQPVLEALEYGAFDYINKPEKNNTKIQDVQDDLIQKVKEAASLDIYKLIEGKNVSVNTNPHTFASILPYDIIALGSSTGGPTALESVITKLPSNLSVPVVIVQHMPQNFIPTFVKRLNELTPLQIEVGRGQEVKPGHIYIASGDKNMIVQQRDGKIFLAKDQKKYDEYDSPSINALFLSVAKVYGKKAIGVILTGMGKDGTKGIIEMKNNGALTIAQNEQSSVVYGMPKEAVKSGKIDAELDLKEIPGYIISSFS